ncbi:MAG TPA: PAS domain S-box protein, partial [Coleofasciculaceae cyanobacterium]
MAAPLNPVALVATMKILVGEDDRVVAQSLQFLLSSYNYAVDIAADGEEALRLTDAFEYHLVLLDVLLPRLNGIEVCRQLRKKGFRQPILLLTGQGEPQQQANTSWSIANALNIGADDSVVKPFDNDELIARIKALLRRGGTVGDPILSWGHLSLDPNIRRVAYRDQLLVLSPKEYAILELFLRHPEMVFSAKVILDQAWSSLESPGEEAVRCHIKDLRQKLMAVGAPKDLIKTVHRVGYRLNPLYAASTPVQVDQSLTAPQVAELRSVNEALQVAMEQLQSAQTELQQRNQELEAIRDELEQRVVERTAELSQREAFLSSIYDGTAQSVFIVDVTETNDFRYVSFNHAAQQFTGLSLQDIQNKTPEEVFGLEMGSLFRQNYERCLQTNHSVTYEDHFIFHDRPIWTLTTLSPLRNSQGSINRMVGTALDISDRKRTEAVLHESEEKYRSLFESIDQGFCLLEVVFDANDKAIDYRFMEINEAFGQQSGLVNPVGKTILELVPNLEPQWAELYGQVAKSGEAVRFEADVPSMSRIFDVYAFPSGTLGQNLVAVLFADITQRKRVEESLRQTAELNAFRVSLADALRPLTDVSEILVIAARILGESLRATRVVYIEVVSAGEAVIVHRNYTHGVAELSGQYRLEDYGRNLIADHQAGHTQVVTDIPDHPRYTEAEKARYRELEIAAHIDVPLIKNNQFVALLAVHQSTPRQWTETEVKRVEETAERTWAAVERAYAEAALHQNEEMLRLALAGAHAGTWNWELATDHLTWSPETYHLYGLDLTASPPTYDDWYENSLHPDDRTWVNHYVDQMMTQRQPDLQLEFRILHPQHGIRWILSLGHLTVNEQGEPIRLSGINLDISDRKQAEQKIREQAALLDISTDAILVCDLDGCILYWNQGAEHLYGWQAEEALGQTANELLSRSPSTFREMKQIVLERGTWHGEIQRFTKTGKEVTVEGRCTLVRDEAGQPKSILSIDTDITEKKSLEAQFYQAQRLESLGTLTSGIAHDLNNTLTPILAIAQLLQMQSPELHARSQEMLQLLEKSAQRGANMVKQILTFTRGTGGERSLVDVASLLQEVVKVAQQTFPKFITIRTTVPAQGIRQVSADATQLHQVVMNLCVNARDAMPADGTLTLSAENFDANEIFTQINLDAHVEQYVLITVADTGTGIAPEVRDRIFDPFFTTKAIGQGTGLGLSTVLGIVRSYGGVIQVASEVGKGTQFKIYLPAVETEAASNLQATTLPQGQGELILVVDDESAILQSTRAILETYHYQVLTARNGTEAIAIYTQYQQDIALVLVDMMMPDMDGITVIR